MATAEQFRAEFTRYMDEKGIKYEVTNESDNIVRLGFAATSSKPNGGARTRIFADFDEQGDDAGSVHFVAFKFARCTKDKYAMVLVKLNEFNARYRWVKFYALPDESGDSFNLSADGDAMLVYGDSAFECVASCFRMSDIVEDAIVELGDLVSTEDEQSAMMDAFLRWLSSQQ